MKARSILNEIRKTDTPLHSMGVGRKHEMRALSALYNGNVPSNAVPILDEPMLRVIAPFIADSIDADKSHLVSIPVPEDDLDIDPGTWWLIRSITVFDDDATAFSEGGFKVKGSKFWNAAHVKGNGIERVVIDTGGLVRESVVCEIKRGSESLSSIGTGREHLYSFENTMREKFPEEMEYVRSFGTSYNDLHHMVESEVKDILDIDDNYEVGYLTLLESKKNFSFMHDLRKWVSSQDFKKDDPSNVIREIKESHGSTGRSATLVYNPKLDAILAEYRTSYIIHVPQPGAGVTEMTDLIFRHRYEGSKWEIKKSPKVSRF